MAGITDTNNTPRTPVQGQFARLPRPQRALNLGAAASQVPALAHHKSNHQNSEPNEPPSINSALSRPKLNRPPSIYSALSRPEPIRPAAIRHANVPPVTTSPVASSPSALAPVSILPKLAPSHNSRVPAVKLKTSVRSTRVNFESTKHLGTLAQGPINWDVHVGSNKNHYQLFMVKHLAREEGVKAERIWPDLDHDNIAKMVERSWKDNILTLGIEYCRHTVRNILHIHLKLQETQVQFIARSVSHPAQDQYQNLMY